MQPILMKPHSLEKTPSQERPRLPRAAIAAVGSAALLALLGATAGCVVAVRPAPVGVVYSAEPAEVVVDAAPPAAIYETVAVAPGPGYFWIGGYYHWNGRWVWNRGPWKISWQP